MKIDLQTACLSVILRDVKKLYQCTAERQRFEHLVRAAFPKYAFDSAIYGKANDENGAFLLKIQSCVDSIIYGESSSEQENSKKTKQLKSIFSLLSGQGIDDWYIVSKADCINYPMQSPDWSKEQEQMAKEELLLFLEHLAQDDAICNRILASCANLLMYFPSFKNGNGCEYISLYNEIKLNVCIAGAIYRYFCYGNKAEREYTIPNDENAFLLFSCDLSGIQTFIYNITSERALKMLRSRSFYIDMLMEHFINSLLYELDLTRANLVYSGGGHAYAIFDNTVQTKEAIDHALENTNNWFIEHFGTELYLAGGYTECSARKLMNMPDEKGASPYSEMFIRLSQEIGRKKLQRYATVDIFVNQMQKGDLVLVPDGDDIYFGEVMSDYYLDSSVDNDSEGYSHQREVKWLSNTSRKSLSKELRSSLKVHRTTANLSHHTNEIGALAQSKPFTPLTNGITNVIEVTYPLRPDFTVIFTIPTDISSDEANRLSIYFKSLYFIK